MCYCTFSVSIFVWNLLLKKNYTLTFHIVSFKYYRFLFCLLIAEIIPLSFTYLAVLLCLILHTHLHLIVKCNTYLLKIEFCFNLNHSLKQWFSNFYDHGTRIKYKMCFKTFIFYNVVHSNIQKHADPVCNVCHAHRH